MTDVPAEPLDADSPADREADPEEEPSEVSLIVRMDFTVTDLPTLLRSAAAALQDAQPELSDAAAEAEIGGSVSDALFALANSSGLDALMDTDGLEVRTTTAEIVYGLEDVTLEPDEF